MLQGKNRIYPPRCGIKPHQEPLFYLTAVQGFNSISPAITFALKAPRLPDEAQAFSAISLTLNYEFCFDDT